MPNKKIIRSRIQFPDTHCFFYKNKRYPFKMCYFELCSKYFLQNSEKFQLMQDIELLELLELHGEENHDELNIDEDTIKNFIKYVQQEEISVDQENVIFLHYLSKRFEVDELEEDTKEYIFSHQDELAIEILKGCQYDRTFEEETYENIISNNFEEYMKNEELTRLPIPKIHRILTKYFNNEPASIKYKEINEFIEEVIDHQGRTASILLSFIRIDESNIDIISNMIEKYSERVDFEFIDFSVTKTILSVLNSQKEAMKHLEEEKEAMKENDEHLKEEISRLRTEFSLKEQTKDEIISNLELKLETSKETSANLIRSKEEEISSLTTKLATIKHLKDEEISSLNQKLAAIKQEKEEEISSLKSQIYSLSIRIDCNEVSKEGPGLLSQLKYKQKTPFDRLFVASQSSSDIYNLLLPHTDDDFETNNNGNFFIEFELEAAVTISGVKIFSSNESFPKSFDISIEGETVKSVTEARELNGKHKDMTVSFAPIRGRKVRFTQTGPSWDQGSNFLLIKGIELLSTDSKYSGGVFSTLVSESENEDPHKCPVIISAPTFDFNSFHSLNAEHKICTYSRKNSWFQVELTRGTAVLNGFRLKKCNPGKLRSYKVICTDDSSKPESSWTTLIEINEETKKEHKLLDIYEFPRPSPPTRIVRLVQTGKNWSDSFFLKFYHFDIFGSCF